MEKHPWGAGAVASGRREHTMNILLTGGAGYIDSQTAVALTEAGHRAGRDQSCSRPCRRRAGAPWCSVPAPRSTASLRWRYAV